MKILVIIFLFLLALGYLFVQWANKPENVAALQKKRVLEAGRQLEDEKKGAVIRKEQAIVRQEIRQKKGSLTLVIDENFANNRFEQLVFTNRNISYFKFGDHEFDFSGMVFNKQNAQDYFIGSTGNFGDFVAEVQLGIWGSTSHAGIFWDAQSKGDRNPTQYQAAYSSPDRLYVEAGEKESASLGGLISSENNQLLRVERFGKLLTVSVNGRILFNKTVDRAASGKVGLFIGHRGGIHATAESIRVGIRSFKVWQ